MVCVEALGWESPADNQGAERKANDWRAVSKGKSCPDRAGEATERAREVEGLCFGASQTWVQVLTLPVTGCVILGKKLHLSEPISSNTMIPFLSHKVGVRIKCTQSIFLV